jgi:hypothetical protein
LVEGGDCGELELDDIGCCDNNGDNWYCGDDGQSIFVVKEVCG